MSQPNRCPECGAELPSGALGGLCPKCLLAAGLESHAERASAGSGLGAPTTPHSTSFIPPDAESLAAHFPQLEILELLGHGGMGAVYKARQPKLDRLVALKIIRPESADDPAFAERFNREARMLARLSHPQIVPVYDFGEVNLPAAVAGAGPRRLYFFLMEYVDGTNLRQLLQSGELLPRQALAIVPQICEALQFAHDEGIVHRDIKPENILLDKRGRVKIADFGLAKLAAGSPQEFTLTGTHQVMGTPRYMAPEQMEGSHAVDHRADIYSLGVVFYEMLTGEVPMGHFEPPSRKVEIDVRLDEVVLRTLAREPQRRYQRASDIKTDVVSISHTPPPAEAIHPIRETPADDAFIDRVFERMRLEHSAIDTARSRLRLPAILLAIIGVISCSLWWIDAILPDPGPSTKEIPEWAEFLAFAVTIVLVMAWYALCLTMIIGAVKILRLTSYRWAMAASIVALSPIPAGPLWLLSLPIGLWALVVLNKPEIKQAFRQRKEKSTAASKSSSKNAVSNKAGWKTSAANLESISNGGKVERRSTTASPQIADAGNQQVSNGHAPHLPVPLCALVLAVVGAPASFLPWGEIITGSLTIYPVAGWKWWQGLLSCFSFLAVVVILLATLPSRGILLWRSIVFVLAGLLAIVAASSYMLEIKLGSLPVMPFIEAAGRDMAIDLIPKTIGQSQHRSNIGTGAFIALFAGIGIALLGAGEIAVRSQRIRAGSGRGKKRMLPDDTATANQVLAAAVDVRAPAIALTCVGVFEWIACWTAAGIAGLAFREQLVTVMGSEDAMGSLLLTIVLLGAILSTLVILAGLKMRRLESRAFCVFGSLVAMLISPGNVIGLPIGIWSLYVLTRPEVKAGFVSRKGRLSGEMSAGIGQGAEGAAQEPQRRDQHASDAKQDVESISVTVPPLAARRQRSEVAAEDAELSAARQQVQLPVVGLLVLSVLALPLAARAFLSRYGSSTMSESPEQILFWLAYFLPPLATLVGAVKMLQLSSHRWAIAASLLVMLSPAVLDQRHAWWIWWLCVLVGIWSLVVLSKHDVKRAFAVRNHRRPAPAEPNEINVQAQSPRTPNSNLARLIANPAWGLIITGVISWVTIPLAFSVPFIEGMKDMNAAQRTIFQISFGVIPLIIGTVMALAGFRMKRLEGYRLAMFAAVLPIAVLIFKLVALSFGTLAISPADLVGAPVGLWVLVVLTRPEVKRAFAGRSELAAPPAPQANVKGAIARVQFTVPAAKDIASLIVFHFSGLGYRIVDERTNQWVFERGKTLRALWETDIRLLKTTLTVRAISGDEGSMCVSCHWAVRKLGSTWVTRRDVRKLEAEGRELEVLIGGGGADGVLGHDEPASHRQNSRGTLGQAWDEWWGERDRWFTRAVLVVLLMFHIACLAMFLTLRGGGGHDSGQPSAWHHVGWPTPWFVYERGVEPNVAFRRTVNLLSWSILVAGIGMLAWYAFWRIQLVRDARNARFWQTIGSPTAVLIAWIIAGALFAGLGVRAADRLYESMRAQVAPVESSQAAEAPGS